MNSYGHGEIPILSGVAEISQHRKAWFCDVWGVLLDGLTVYAPAIEACRAFKASGGEIVLVTNSPKPSAAVLIRLHAMGVPEDCFTALVSSGDATRALIEAYCGEPVFHIGPEHDKSLFDGLNVAFAPPAKAAAIVCTGFFDEDREVVEDYEDMLAGFAVRGVPMICANPDLVVERGSKLVPCAGLLAQHYEALGQTVFLAGKPHRPIYEAATRRLSHPLPQNEILAIGDGIDTDIKGACAQGIDAIYIASRVHMGDAPDPGASSMQLIGRLFEGRPFRPAAAMFRLGW